MDKGILANDKRFKNLMAGFQSIVIAVGVVVGGCWGAFAFYQQRLGELATLETKLKLDALTKDSDISVQISIDSIKRFRDVSIVFGTLHLTNRGDRLATVPVVDRLEIGYAKPPYRYDSEFEKIGNVRVCMDITRKLGRQSVSARATERIPFSIPLAASGLYMLSYTAPAWEQDVGAGELAKSRGKEDPKEVYWQAVQFFVIP